MLKIEKNYKDGSTHTEYIPYDEIETTLIESQSKDKEDLNDIII